MSKCKLCLDPQNGVDETFFFPQIAGKLKGFLLLKGGVFGGELLSQGGVEGGV